MMKSIHHRRKHVQSFRLQIPFWLHMAIVRDYPTRNDNRKTLIEK